MGNTLLTIGQVAKKQMFVLKNTCSALPLVTSEYSGEFAVKGAKVGTKITIRKPTRYVLREGQKAVLQDTQEQYVTLTLSHQQGVDTPFSMVERTLSLDDYQNRVAVPKMATIANGVDLGVLAIAQKFGANVGTPGSVPTALSTFTSAAAVLSELGCPKAQRSVVMTPTMHGSVASANAALFNPQNAVSELWRTGVLTQYAGMKFYEDQNLPAHTMGPRGGTPVVNGAGQVGSSLVTDGWTAAAAARVAAGDPFTLTDVYEVNPQSRQSTGRLRQFVAVADGASDASGNLTLSISPEIIPTGAFQNVTASPANDAALTFVGTAGSTYRYGVAMHKGAILVGFADIELPPKGVVEAFRVVDDETGISMATVTGFDVMGGQTVTRTDVVWGAIVGYEDLLVRIWQ